METADDRLSELPESLIFHIFWFLPIRDVVRTTVLSKRWKNLWATCPYLNLDHSSITLSNFETSRNLVNLALMLWEGTNIHKFNIDFRSQRADAFLIDLDCWVQFAIARKVQELYLRFDMQFFDLNLEFEGYTVPQCLYSCPWLKVLSLVGCRFRMNGGNVRWNQLKSLTIHCDCFAASAIDQILCGSPQLEVLILVILNTKEKWSIRSSSLKRLSIWHDAYFSMDLGLRIWTPNLETLEISGIPFRNYSLMGVSSLTHLSLGFYDIPYLTPQYISDEEKISIEEALRQILPTIQQVEKVELSDGCIQVLGDMSKEDLLAFSNVKFLKLNNRDVEYEQIVGVVECFPKLNALSLRGVRNSHCPDAWESFGFDTDIPNSCLPDPKPLMKIVLKYASKLEKMVIRGMPFSVTETAEDAEILPDCGVDFLRTLILSGRVVCEY